MWISYLIWFLDLSVAVHGSVAVRSRSRLSQGSRLGQDVRDVRLDRDTLVRTVWSGCACVYVRGSHSYCGLDARLGSDIAKA